MARLYALIDMNRPFIKNPNPAFSTREELLQYYKADLQNGKINLSQQLYAEFVVDDREIVLKNNRLSATGVFDCTCHKLSTISSKLENIHAIDPIQATHLIHQQQKKPQDKPSSQLEPHSSLSSENPNEMKFAHYLGIDFKNCSDADKQFIIDFVKRYPKFLDVDEDKKFKLIRDLSDLSSPQYVSFFKIMDSNRNLASRLRTKVIGDNNAREQQLQALSVYKEERHQDRNLNQGRDLYQDPEHNFAKYLGIDLAMANAKDKEFVKSFVTRFPNFLALEEFDRYNFLLSHAAEDGGPFILLSFRYPEQIQNLIEKITDKNPAKLEKMKELGHYTREITVPLPQSVHIGFFKPPSNGKSEQNAVLDQLLDQQLDLECPITLEIPEDPVVIQGDKIPPIYEREALEAHIKANGHHPVNYERKITYQDIQNAPQWIKDQIAAHQQNKKDLGLESVLARPKN
ncbi:hypothetical protein ACQUW5_11935 [Legionella sp. CNM-1927-20]|uniref:hypothetical protein n=1 Tax=Legionella sp. CNM-1927-20 TaxID=3422221 RepID=UPI00403B1D62